MCQMTLLFFSCVFGIRFRAKEKSHTQQAHDLTLFSIPRFLRIFSRNALTPETLAALRVSGFLPLFLYVFLIFCPLFRRLHQNTRIKPI